MVISILHKMGFLSLTIFSFLLFLISIPLTLIFFHSKELLAYNFSFSQYLLPIL